MNLDNSNILVFDLNKTYNLFNLNAKQGDTTGSRGILFKIIKDSIPFSLENLTIQIGGKKPDGTFILDNVEIVDATNSIVQVNLTTQMVACEGILQLELNFIKDNAKLSSYPFEVNVIKSVSNFKAIISDNDFGVLNDALNKVNGYNEELQNAVNTGKEEVYNNIKNDFEPLKSELQITVANGNSQVSSLENLNTEYTNKINDLNNSNSLEQVKQELSVLSDKHATDITVVKNSISNNTNELNKFQYTKLGSFSVENSKNGVIRIWGRKTVNSSKDGTWITVNLPITLPNNNYIVNLTCIDGRVDNSFRRIKLGNNQNPKSFDVFIDWCTGFDFEVICPLN